MEITKKHKDKIIKRPDDVFNIFKAILKASDKVDQDREHFWTIGLNSKNQISYIELVSLGILKSSLVHPREVFRFAVMKDVVAIICAHNHPSGDVKPSEDDIDVTKRLIAAGEILGVNINDHLIIGKSNYISLKEKGLI